MDSRTKKTNNKRFVRYPEGAEMYSMSLSKFQQLAKDAKACYKMNRLVLVNLDYAFQSPHNKVRTWGFAPNPTRGAASGLRKGQLPLEPLLLSVWGS